MKNINLFFPLSLVLAGLTAFGQSSFEKAPEGMRITFEVDMSGVEVPDNATVGVWGDTPPFSWTEPTVMKDIGEGMYSVTVDFSEAEPGQLLHYKYAIGGDIWELTRYHDLMGARFCFLNKGWQMISSVWDENDAFSPRALMDSDGNKDLYCTIFLIGNGKKRGLTIEEIVAEENAFWGDVSAYMQSTLDELAISMEIRQAFRPGGHFEVLERSPGKITFKIASFPWMYYYNKAERAGYSLYGVTREDLETYDNLWMNIFSQQRNWKVT